jgi:hypothetical protein
MGVAFRLTGARKKTGLGIRGEEGIFAAYYVGRHFESGNDQRTRELSLRILHHDPLRVLCSLSQPVK